MPLHRRQRRILLFLGLVLAGCLLLWLAVPVWFPWLLRPLLAREGASYARYDRLGVSGFVVYDLSITNQGIRLRAQRLEALLPTTWLWRHSRHASTQASPFLVLRGWQLDFETTPSGHGTTTNVDVYDGFTQVDDILEKLEYWLPSATFVDGKVILDKTILHLPEVMWSRSNLTASVVWPAQAQRAMLKLSPTARHAYQLTLRSDSLHLESAARLARDATGLTLQSSNVWWRNPLQLEARFGRQGLWPQKAKVEARNFHLPSELTRLREFQAVSGSAEAEWEAGQFDLHLDAAALPQADQTNLPPLQVSLQAQGDTNLVTVQTATVSAPWLRVELSEGLRIHLRGPLLESAAQLRISADLSRQPWLPLKGSLKGEAQIAPANGKLPQAHFTLSGSGVRAAQFEIAALRLVGDLNWPWLELTKMELTPATGSQASLEGKLDLEKATVADGHVEFSGPWARRFLPEGYSYQDIALDARVHGPLKSLRYGAHLAVTNLTTPITAPLQLESNLEGEAAHKAQATLALTSGQSRLSLDAAFEAGAAGTNIFLRTLTLQSKELSILELAHPCRVSLDRVSPDQPFALRVAGFQWTGSGGQVRAGLALDWPRRGTFSISVQDLASAGFAEFAKTNIGEFKVRNLEAACGWTNGPATFVLDFSGSAATRNGLELSLATGVTGTKHGLVVSNLVVTTTGNSPVARLEGSLPVTFEPGSGHNFLVLQREAPLRLTALTDPGSSLWNSLADYTGITLLRPDLRITLAGNWNHPQGEIRLDAQRILTRATGTNVTIENLHSRLALDRQKARLTDCQLLLEGQPVFLTAEIPLGKNLGRGESNGPFLNWQEVSANLRINNAKLVALAKLFPAVLAPQGELNLAVSLRPGVRLDGALTVHGARTRPLATIGPLRDIELNLTCHDRALTLERAQARIGASVLVMNGEADLRGTNWLVGKLPPLELTLRGTNVPLSRRPDSIIHSDLDLAITKTNAAAPLISGQARLRDSFYLSDLAELVSGGVAQPSQRPPYFSVTEPFLADWRAAVKVTGLRFLKVRSTLFGGEVSANLNLQGTLKEPLLLGDLKIDSGSVNFPFANLQIQQGLVTLSSANPYRPQLAVAASSKQFSYDLRLEISGFADAPVIQFSSNPPLSSEQILLMVTAGTLPGGVYALTPQQRAQTMALFLGRDLLAKLGLGDQTEQRLTIHSGEEISEVGKPTYDVEYKLSPRWWIVGEYDRFGDFNAGLKWQIYAK